MAHHRPAEPREQMSPQERAETRERSMALLRQMLRPHRGALALSIISVLLVSGSSAVAPLLIARVLGSSIEPLKQGDASVLLTLLAFFVAATAVTAIFSWSTWRTRCACPWAWWCTCVSGCSVTRSR